MVPDPNATLLDLFRVYLEGFADETVRSYIAAIGETMARRTVAPRPLPCLRHLDGLAQAAPPDAAGLVSHLADRADTFSWGQTYTAEDFGPDFLARYGWLELFGTRGQFVNDGMAAGFLVLGPHVHYPDHHHIAEEVYIPLTGGARWRKGDGDYAAKEAGAVIHHPSGVSHAMRTGDEALLALYLWRGGPLAQKSVIGAAIGAA